MSSESLPILRAAYSPPLSFSSLLQQSSIFFRHLNSVNPKKLYVDCETTGTDPRRNGVIQFSAVAVIDGKEAGGINIKMTPFEKDEIEETALEVNQITKEELFSLTRCSPKEGHAKIVEFLAQYVDKFNPSDKFMWFGYKAAFDSDFMRQFFTKNNDNFFGSWFFTPPLCVMTLAGYLLQKERAKLENFKLRTVYNYLHPENKTAFTENQWHDSFFDIYRTIDIESALRQRVMATRSR